MVRVSVDRNVLKKVLCEKGITYGDLADEIEKITPCSVSSIHRWNNEGWPELHFCAMVLILEIEPEEVEEL